MTSTREGSSAGIRTLVPDEDTCIEVDQIIFDELTQESSRMLRGHATSRS